LDRHTQADDLNAFVDDALSETERARIESLLARDPAIAREIAELRATARLLHDLPEYTPRRSFRLGDEYAGSPKPHVVAPMPARGKIVRFLPIVRSLSVAAALVFMVVAGSLFFDVNGGSDTDAGTTFQAQNAVMGNTDETDSAAHSSDEAEDADEGESSMTSRGDAAAAGDEPMQDLTQFEESTDEVAQSTTSNAIGSPFAPVGEDEDRTPWVWSSVAFGGLALVLAGLWFLLAKAGRQSSARGS